MKRPSSFMLPNDEYKIYMDDFPRLAVEVDDSPSMNRAVAECIRRGIGHLYFSPKQYFISSQTVDFSAASGIYLEGAGFDPRGTNPMIKGTEIKRTANIVAFSSIGGTVSTGGTNNRGIRMSGIRFQGGDFMEDFMRLIATAVVITDDVMFTGSGGRHILLHEVMDSRFNDSIFEWGGTSDGTIPMLELRSGSGYEFTNQVHFDGVRMESYRGVAFETTGSNSNEIYFAHTKMEGLASNQPHMKLANANVINFGGLNICSKGTVGQTLPAQITIDNCAGITGVLQLEHTGTIDSSAAKINCFVDIKNMSTDIDLLVYVYQNGASTIQSNPVMVDSTSNVASMKIKGSVRNNNREISNIPEYQRSSSVVGSSPYRRLKFSPTTSWDEYWDVKILGDGPGSKLVLNHNKAGVETTVFQCLNSHDFQFNENFFMMNKAMHLARLAAAPYGQNGSLYYDSTNNVLKAYINGAWKTVTVT